MLGVFVAIAASTSAPAAQTDFGIRVVGAPFARASAAATRAAVETLNSAASSAKLNLSSAASLGSQWGRVTSTYRSPEHNRAVGGVRNSFHLSGRAVDIARRAGVNHHAIDSAFRRAGYRVVESLDEGDHSHFAFSFGAPVLSSLRPNQPFEVTEWRIVYAPAGR